MEFVREPISAEELAPNLARAVSPGAPGPMKMMAARGMLPAGPSENLMVLYSLHDDDDEKIASEAVKSVQGLPLDILLSGLGGLTNASVLDWLVEHRSHEDRVVEAVLLNSACADATVVHISESASANIADLIATNQVRVLRCPKIIETLYVNPNARMATVDRLVDLARRNQVELKGLPALKEAMQSEKVVFESSEPPAAQEPVAESGDEPDVEAFASLLQMEALKASFDDEGPASQEAAEEEIDDDAPEEIKNLSMKISRMSISQKIRLAVVGSRSAIAIMVNDSNKLVHMAAIRSPRVQYADARKWSKNKSLPDGVIGYIASNRDWTRHYEIQYNLVANPKTPLSEAMGFVKRLRTNDLKQLSKNRNVPHQIARMAKQLYEQRNSGRR